MLKEKWREKSKVTRDTKEKGDKSIAENQEPIDLAKKVIGNRPLIRNSYHWNDAFIQ